MPDPVFWTAAAIALSCSFGSLGCAMRFLTNLRIPAAGTANGLALILPATGRMKNLEHLLADLRGQTLPIRRLIVAVESPDDPAFARVSALARTDDRLRIELVVAGVSDRRAQKCTNILAALSRLDAEDRFVVMLDADIRPQPWWLAALVVPLAEGRADIVNGYRWLMPEQAMPRILAIVHIDRTLAVLPRFGPAAMLWGGSLAMTRDALATLDLPRALDRAVVDDMPIANRMVAARLRLLTRRALRVPTPLRGNWQALWAFACRQAKYVRLYRPWLWCYALAVVTADLVSRIVLVGDLLTAGSLRAGATLAVIAALGNVATGLRCRAGRRVGAPDSLAPVMGQHLLVCATLPIAALYAGVLWASAFAGSMRWAHVEYELDQAGNVLAARRRPHGVDNGEV
jgi:hypothetical protein